MKAFLKIQATKSRVSKEQVQIGKLFLSRDSIFTKEEISEISEKIREEMPFLDRKDDNWSILHLKGHFDMDTAYTSKFMYILVCIKDEEGKDIFKLVKTPTGEKRIQLVGDISSILDGKTANKDIEYPEESESDESDEAESGDDPQMSDGPEESGDESGEAEESGDDDESGEEKEEVKKKPKGKK